MVAHPRPADPRPLPAPGALVPPVDGEVLVWWATTDVSDATLGALRANLDDDTRGRIDALAREPDRRRGTVAHGLLRRLVAACTGQAPAAVTLHRRCASCGAADHGKPALSPARGASQAPLQFNLAHSGGVVIVALSGPTTEVGVDVEASQPDVDWEPSRRHVFTADEWDHTAGALDPTLERFSLWARKEAAAKATGLGLSIDLSAVTLSPEPFGDGARRAELAHHGRTHQLLVVDVGLTSGVVGAVAIVGDGRAPRVTVARAALGSA